MIIIISQIILALSILGILFLILRKVPNLLKYPRNSSKTVPIQDSLKDQWDKVKERTGLSEFFHDVFFPKTEKFLRKLKAILLRFDNFLARRVDGLRARMRRRKRKKKRPDSSVG